MPEGNPLRELLKQFVQNTIDELNTTQGTTPNEIGTVIFVHTDGSIDIAAASGVYTNVGTPVKRVLGEQVTVITADSKKVAL